ncbi:selenite/tellurite reduction operon protein ExtJ [Geotalea toluenoxydans]|uniref:selenite/tellurite reduction operon protein ExtJ n=1 Tax=Geotalea toluenoxydans TaxID=421624 RepID=UPI0006CF75F7|nr:selenite/tellurite reduction operon protein ExtJ [Geotalea toluenoxydans]
MKRMITKLATIFALAAFATAAFAAGSVTGKVTAIDGEKVSVTVEKELPAWVKKGDSVQAMGGSPTVVDVKGNVIVLKFGKAKAAKIKADSKMTISESAGDELQGC